MIIHPYAITDVQYVGKPGMSVTCKVAVMRYIQYGDQISSVRILTCEDKHCLLLLLNGDELVVVKSGFASGYAGEGPRTFSFVLALLNTLHVEIDECEVNQNVFERVDASALTLSDLHKVQSAAPIRPVRWYEYILELDADLGKQYMRWKAFPIVMPWSFIDSRIMDLAIRFVANEDECLLTGYRRLEDLIRQRTGLEEHGAKLFSQAFLNATAKLGWNVSSSEQTARGNLFTAVYSMNRNPRAHRELASQSSEQMIEFLLLNNLYLLERDTIPKP